MSRTVDPIRDAGKLRELTGAVGNRHPKYAVMLVLGVETGLRISDILAIKARDVHPDAVAGWVVTEKKTGHKRRVSLRPETVRLIRAYVKCMGLGPRDYLVYSRENAKGVPLSRGQAWRVLSSISQNLGLQRIGTHSMRKTYAVNEYCKFGDVSALKQDLGHKDRMTTLSYLMSREQMEDMIGR